MEEKRNERNEKSRRPKMKIDEKCSKRGPKMMKKSRKSESRGRKIKENGDRGCLQEATKHLSLIHI